MKKTTKRLLAVLLAVVLVIGLLPSFALAGHRIDGEGKASESAYVFTEADHAVLQNDVFARIENVKAASAAQLGGIGRMTEQDYIDLVPQVISAIESSETYVPGTLRQNGFFLVWETTVGIPCCYDPHMEAELNNTENDPAPAEIAKAEEQAAALAEAVSTRGGGSSSLSIGLIQPYWASSGNYADSSFNNYSPSYKAMWSSLAEATGGSAIRYTMTDATVDNIASALEQCGIVIFDSHGATDYNGGNGDAASQANTSYLCLTTSVGLNTEDTAAQEGPFGTYYHAIAGLRYAYVDGTAIANHMSKNAPNSLLYMAICYGMATDGLEAPLRAKGVEVVYGYSQEVTFIGEEFYMNDILSRVRDGMAFGQAVLQAKEINGWWDPHPDYVNYTEEQAVSEHIAFPIVVSSEDVYPGQGSVDAIQNVNSAWSLFGGPNMVTAVSNNADWGTVSLSGWYITANPDPGCYIEGYSVTSGTAAVTCNDNIFTVAPETDCVVEIIFAQKTPATVTCMAGSTVVSTEATYVGEDVGLPVESTEFVGWSFIGWMDHPLEETLRKPDFYEPGAVVTVTVADPVFYALYKHVEAGAGICYERETWNNGQMSGRYVISSSKSSDMAVMTGVSAGYNLESGNLAVTAFADTGMELDGDVLRFADEAYLFDFNVNYYSDTYSIRSVSKGS